MQKSMLWIAPLGWACVALFTTSSAIADNDWRSFQNDGTNTNAVTKLPTEWSPTNGVRWKLMTPGYGQSSPVIYGEQIFVTSTDGANKEKLFVTAVERKTGKKAWSYELKNSSPEKSSEYFSRAAPTPVCDKRGVIAFFEGGNLVALDRAGKLRWELDLVKKYGPIKARHGLASSLAQNPENIFVWIEREEKPYVVAVSKSDGKVVWKTDGVGSTTWSSPRLIKVDGQSQLVLNASGKLVGINPANGKQLWTFAEIANNSSTTPIPLGKNRILVGASTGRGEQPATPIKSNGVIEIKKDGEKFKAEWVWRARKATSSFGSPLAYRGNAYFVNNVGAIYCHDLESGKQIYVQRAPSGTVWATPIAIGDQIFLFGKDGRTAVIKAGTDYQLISKNELWKSAPAKTDLKGPTPGVMSVGKQVLYAAVAVDGQLILRSGQVLYCIGN